MSRDTQIQNDVIGTKKIRIECRYWMLVDRVQLIFFYDLLCTASIKIHKFLTFTRDYGWILYVWMRVFCSKYVTLCSLYAVQYTHTHTSTHCLFIDNGHLFININLLCCACCRVRGGNDFIFQLD